MEDSAEKQKKKSLANTKSPIIQAIIDQSYVFSNKAAALKKLAYVSDRFVRSSLTNELESASTVLWIRGYALTPQEEESGFVGNYAMIGVENTANGSYTISASKLPIELSKHPQRVRKKGKHPDWGYWVLRRVQKNWRYDSIDEAYGELMQLVEDYPEVSIPAQNKIYTIVYHKREEVENPLVRIVLEVEALPQGGFTITWKENHYQRSEAKSSKKTQQTEDESPQQVGRFTSMVMVKQNKRKNISDMVKKPSEGG